MKKQVIYIVSVFLIFAFTPVSLFSQGCEDVGDEEGVQVKGYIQPQYSYFMNGKDSEGNSLDENSFNFNRARLGVVGNIPYDISYYFFVEVSPFKGTSPAASAHLLDAFITYTRFGKYAKISIGQFKAPISLEQNTPCHALTTIYRSDVVDQLAGPQRDLGLMILGGNDTTFLRYSIAVMHGAGKGIYDNNKGKDIVGRLLIHPIEPLTIGGSFRTGQRNPTDLNERQNDILRIAGEFKFELKGFVLQGEYIYGQDKLYSTSRIPIYGGCGGIIGFETKQPGTYTKGGYWIMASYKTSWNLEPVLKYDTYDPDMDLGNDWYSNFTVGLNYFLNDWTRIQLNYIRKMEAAAIATNNDLIVFQIQVKF